MKELLTAIKTQLRGDSNLSYVRDQDIFVVPDENMIPVTALFPAVGLKDGPIERLIDSNRGWEVIYTVYAIVYQTLSEGETPVMGQTNPTIYGVIDIADHIHASLDENLLSITGMMLAYPGDEFESEAIGAEDLLLQKKKLVYKYHKWEDRP